ncbi:MAG: HK97 family phage prohead protease [Prevotella sp.]|nr:HK97 family phage prohead protease [Prevotella sp.]
MPNKKREIRTPECKFAVREREGVKKGESRTITGTAIVFNQPSQILEEGGQRFREIILPSAASMDFLKTQDIKMNLLHQRDKTVARWNQGIGSLRLWVDNKGVNFEFEAPKSYLGDHVLEMVRRGDYSGCSFEFWPKYYDIKENGNETTIYHRTFEAIGALTIGLDPAYPQTSVSIREMLNKDDEQRGFYERKRLQCLIRLMDTENTFLELTL